MAACSPNQTVSVLVSEFEKWNEESGNTTIYLLEAVEKEDGSSVLTFNLGGEHDFKLLCPAGYPLLDSHFLVESTPHLDVWCNMLNEFLLDSPPTLRIHDILLKAVSLFKKEESPANNNVSSDEESMEEDNESSSEDIQSDDTGAFTTEWELKLSQNKKRWLKKDAEVREAAKRARLTAGLAVQLPLTCDDAKQASQVFSNSASSGILINDLVAIMENEKEIGISAEAIDDNIYHWCIKMFNFEPNSDLTNDLIELKSRYGYDYIELELTFTMDLYPFYPPLVKVLRPRLQSGMMQRITSMEILKLSFWNPAKSMQEILLLIKALLQEWARLKIDSPLNDITLFPQGSYLEIENHLYLLTMVSEVTPRANKKFLFPSCKPYDNKVKHTAMGMPSAHINQEYQQESDTDQMFAEMVQEFQNGFKNFINEERELCLPQIFFTQNTKKKHSKPKEQSNEYWAAGTGYGHSKRPGWDLAAYIAAQKVKDKQISLVLQNILNELRSRRGLQPSLCNQNGNKTTQDMSTLLISNNLETIPATQIPTEIPDIRNDNAMDCELSFTNSIKSNEKSELEEHLYEVLEQSALIPFLENHLQADSFLEICRHISLYQSVLDVIKEIVARPDLITLLGPLSDQKKSLQQLLKGLEDKASTLLRISKVSSNGSIPQACTEGSSIQPELSFAQRSAEEQLIREFCQLSQNVTALLEKYAAKNLISLSGPDSPKPISTEERETLRYQKVLRELQFQNSSIPLSGKYAHHYAQNYLKNPNPSGAQVFRIAQELSTISTSLPLDTSSSIFVLSDEDKCTTLRALITGPEGTPYSGGCYIFDIFFPKDYPSVPPLVNLMTTGGNSVRFNPNLYACGKVCLSLLGTWMGQKGEQWNEHSTLLQVLVSIQSLILVSDPYFNEPGFESQIGTERGKKNSMNYNQNVRMNNIKWAMINQLQNPLPGFEEVILLHFHLKKDKILQEVDKWVKENSSSGLQGLAQTLLTELNKLKLTEKCWNLLADK